MKRKRYKKLSYGTVKAIKRLLDGYRLKHGYTIVKRKRKKHRKTYKLFF